MSQNAPEPKLQIRIVPVTPLQQNCSLIWDTATKHAAFVDPGGDIDKLLGALAHFGLTLKRIWLTHGHLDHAGAAADLRQRTGVAVEGPHRDDQFWLDQIEDSSRRYGITGGRNVTPDRYLEDGDTLELEGVKFDVAHTPGHTPGHVVIHNRAARIAFVGDVLFAGSIGRTDFPRGNHQQLIDSITGKLWPLGDDMTFVPGHGPTSTFGRERQTNPFVADSLTGYAGAQKTAPNDFDQKTSKRYT
ncbi:MAG: MBL fold metallo-hydrolase [Alphaproteobacteria bacterium]|jgi:glyoxylase-like metal-dependent hydrolase (beta-lactamase superfamily II)|nr:MBL fold metallo-hydrolase [Alphaproteobacteria bacterium]